MDKVVYSVHAVTRYVVTRSTHQGDMLFGNHYGLFEREEQAREVAAAMCKVHQDRLGLAASDERVTLAMPT